MVTIAINHLGVMLMSLGYSGRRIPTLTLYGFSTAAEIFFLLSGYMIGFIYLRSTEVDPTYLRKKVLSRAWKIYLFNVSVFGMLLVMAPFLPVAVADATKLDYTLEDVWSRSLLFLGFLQHPSLLGVLQLYVLLMVLTPWAARLAHRSSVAMFMLSAALYTGVRLAPGFNLPGGAPESDGLWEFNPFAWQLLFFCGMLLGQKQAHRTLFGWLDRHWSHPYYAFAIFAGAAVVFKLHHAGVIAVPSVSKMNVGVANLVHTFVAVLTMAAIATELRKRARWLTRWFGIVGKHTLECYALSIPLTYAAAAVWVTFPGRWPTYVAAAGAVVAGVTALAFAMEHRHVRAAAIARSGH